jgi:hypothetical protein
MLFLKTPNNHGTFFGKNSAFLRYLRQCQLYTSANAYSLDG